MSAGRRQRGALPRLPLDFADRTRLPAAEVAGARILSELPGPAGREVWRVLRLVLDFAAGQHAVEWFDAAYLDAWEEHILRGPLEAPLRLPLGVIVGELTAPHEAERPLLGHGCWCVADWASGRYEETALAFAEAAALCWPENGRYAMVAGRLFRKAGRLREAELWLRRARRLAVWHEDWEAAVLSTSSMGMLEWERGNYKPSIEHLEQAERLARRHQLRRLEGEVLHNRVLLAVFTGQTDAATTYAEAALDRYLPVHPQLPALAYDLAYLWLTKGYARRALPVFESLLPHFKEPERRLQVYAAIAKAAGLLGDRDRFRNASARVEEIAAIQPRVRTLAAALVDAGLGAAELGDAVVAREALQRGLAVAEAAGQADMVVAAERAINRIDQPSKDGLLRDPRSGLRAHDELAERFVRVLEEQPASC
ncbi:MAG TPA: hypothetical protein VFQ45_17465 [Longimicrobium sp.]|nr:hypothetical protein [Longimicrobium sp.]